MGHLSRFSIFTALMLAVGCGNSDAGSPRTAGPTASSQEEPGAVDQTIQNKAIVKPITGTVDGAAFAGQLRITKFIANGDKIFAVATITQVTGSISAAAVDAIQGETYQIPVELSQDASSLS